MIDPDVRDTHLETLASCLGVDEIKEPDAFIGALRGLLGLASAEGEDEESEGEPKSEPINVAMLLGKKK